jgi:hypothetical protein
VVYITQSFFLQGFISSIAVWSDAGLVIFGLIGWISKSIWPHREKRMTCRANLSFWKFHVHSVTMSDAKSPE